jgi:hypothetical protein
MKQYNYLKICKLFSGRHKPSPPWRGEMNDSSIKTTRGGFPRTKEKLIIVANVASDDKNYKAYKSATQQKIHSSNAGWLIKIFHKLLVFLNPIVSISAKLHFLHLNTDTNNNFKYQYCHPTSPLYSLLIKNIFETD